MKIKYNKNACAGWFQCVQKWDEFEMDTTVQKATLLDSKKEEDGTFSRKVPSDKKQEAIEAAESCPVNAISIIE